MSALRLMWTELSRFTTGPFLRHLVPLALMLIPTLYGVLYLWSNWDPYGKMKHVPVAVVNLDRPVTVLGQHVDAGDQFVKELHNDRSLDWQFVDAQTAAQGVKDGKYAFSVTVPADFSGKLTSPLTLDPMKATLFLELNDANGYIAGKVAETADLELMNKISQAAFKAYTKGALSKLIELHDSLTTAANGAEELAIGADAAAKGGKELADGIGQLDNGADQLADGAGQLASGAAQVADGTDQLVAALSGALALADEEIVHLGRLISTEARALHPLVAAATVVADRLAADATKFNKAVIKACTCKELRRLTAHLERDTKALAKAMHHLADRLQHAGRVAPRDLQELAALLTSGTRALLPLAHAVTLTADDAYEHTSTLLTLLKKYPQLKPLLPRATEINELAKQGDIAQHHVEDALRHLIAMLRDVSAKIPGLQAKIDEGMQQVRLLDDGAHQVAEGAGTLADGAGQLRDGLDQAAPGAATLAQGLSALDKGAVQLADGLASGAAQIPVLDKSTSERTAEVLSSPVQLKTSNLNPATLYGRGLAPFFFSIALWVFGLIAYQLLRAANPRALAGKTSAPAIAAGAWMPAALLGAGGAGVLYLVTDLGLDLNAKHPLGTIGMMLLGMGSFVAIAHLLRLAFGTVGELLTLILLMLQLTSSGGLYPMQTTPKLFQGLHPFMPMTYLIDGLRVTISGGLGSHLARDIMVLGTVLLGALVLSTLVVMRQRRWASFRLHPPIEM